jgi:1,2-phenylacetyl-CoA epoxidase PaaB subunit
VRKSKKPARREPPAWEVYRLKSSPAAFLGIVYAEDEESALAAAIKEHNVRPVDQKRLFARPR